MIVRVTNLETHASIIVRVNDRGPFVDNRVIDLSAEAAKRLGFYEKGTARVKIESVYR
jgi:rare lipoprotein A